MCQMDLLKRNLFKWCKLLFYFLHCIVSRLCTQKTFKYEKSADVCNIWFRYKRPEKTAWSSKEDFIYTHFVHTHPNIILKDEVSLYTITADEAIFVNCGKVDVFDSRVNPFTFNAQFISAVQLIILPISSFNKISKCIPIPKIPIVHLASHGRCGSTILSQVFQAVPKALSISEMLVFSGIAELSRSGEHDEYFLKQLCFSTIMCMLKHANSRQSSLVFFKCQNIVAYITDLLIEVSPAISHLYMYRQPVPFVRSYEKLSFIFKFAHLSADLAMIYSGIGYNKILMDYPTYTANYVNELSYFSRLALAWITGVAAYNKLLSKRYKIRSVKYEDFLSNPEETILALFKYANVPISYLPDLKSVMSKDSQAGTMYSSRGVDKQSHEHRYTKITEKLKCEVDKLCYDFKVPLFWDDVHLDNKLG